MMFSRIPNGFEDWCLRPLSEGEPRSLTYKIFRRQHPNEGDIKLLVDQFQEEVQMGLSKGKLHISLNNLPGGETFSLAPDKKILAPSSDEVADIELFSIDANQLRIKLSNISIYRLNLHHRVVAILNNCYIANLDTHDVADIDLKNCWVGSLNLLNDSSVNDLNIAGGGVLNINCAPPGNNPLNGSVNFLDPFLPTSKKQTKLFKGAQAYRNLRAHFEKLENGLMAGLMRTKELGTELHDDRGLNKYVNWLYGISSGYGTLPGRPLKLAFCLYVFSFIVIAKFDGGVQGISAIDTYAGWRELLIDPDWGTLWRSLLLPLQSILSPINFLSPRKLIVAATWYGAAFLTVQGLITDVFLFLTVLSIRKRFKFH